MQRVAIAVAALLFVVDGQTGWKFYGTSMLGREELRSFYDDWTVTRNGDLQVSEKSFLQKVAKR